MLARADHGNHPGCDHPSHHITGENMLISEIYADTWDWPGEQDSKSYEREQRSILAESGVLVG